MGYFAPLVQTRNAIAAMCSRGFLCSQENESDEPPGSTKTDPLVFYCSTPNFMDACRRTYRHIIQRRKLSMISLICKLVYRFSDVIPEYSDGSAAGLRRKIDSGTPGT